MPPLTLFRQHPHAALAELPGCYRIGRPCLAVALAVALGVALDVALALALAVAGAPALALAPP